jgi:hypothetical protein
LHRFIPAAEVIKACALCVLFLSLVYFINTLARELEMLMFAVGVLLPIAPFLTVDL